MNRMVSEHVTPLAGSTSLFAAAKGQGDGSRCDSGNAVEDSPLTCASVRECHPTEIIVGAGR